MLRQTWARMLRNFTAAFTFLLKHGKKRIFKSHFSGTYCANLHSTLNLKRLYKTWHSMLVQEKSLIHNGLGKEEEEIKSMNDIVSAFFHNLKGNT